MGLIDYLDQNLINGSDVVELCRMGLSFSGLRTSILGLGRQICPSIGLL